MSTRPHVLILGGGFVAIGAVRKLRPAIRRREIDVTVVDRENYKCYHGWVAEFLVGRIGPSNVLNSHRRMFRGAKVIVAEVEHIDLDRRTVRVERGVDGVHQELRYDSLILGLGSVDNLDIYPGLVEHAFKLKTYDDCFRLRTHILNMFEMAEHEPDPVERRRLLTFFIAGGGYAGSEVAGEIADHARVLCAREYRGIDPADVRVVIVHPGQSILPELTGGDDDSPRHAGLVRYATKHLRGMGVEIRTGTYVSSASHNEVRLSDGDCVATRTIISAVGTSAPPVFADLDVPKDRRGRVATDRFLRVGTYDNVYAGGDAASVPMHTGEPCPAQALYARRHGILAAENILSSMRGDDPEPFKWRVIGQGVPLGRRKAVAELKGIPLRGTLAWAILKGFLIWYTPTWDRRLRLLADWTVTGLTGRDIVENSVTDTDDYELHHHLYQPGEIIAHEGRADRYVHVILEGDVELLHGSNGTEQIIATLGPGQHVGQSWRDHAIAETARARTVVRTVALRTDQTRDLQRVMAHLEQLVAADAAPAVAADPA